MKNKHVKTQKKSPAEKAALRCSARGGFGRVSPHVDASSVPALINDLYSQLRPAAGLVGVLNERRHDATTVR